MRRFRSFVVVVLMAGGLFFAQGVAAHACSCLQQTYEQHYANADVVFDGIMQSFVGNEVQSQYEFKVMETFKGTTKDPQSVVTPFDSAACGEKFDKDVAYRVFAKNDGGTLKTNLCMGNIKTTDAPKITTTTATKPTPTTTKPAAVTTTTEPSTTTSSSSTSTTVGDEAVVLNDSDDGGAGWVLPVAIGAVVVAGGVGFALYRRSRGAQT